MQIKKLSYSPMMNLYQVIIVTIHCSRQLIPLLRVSVSCVIHQTPADTVAVQQFVNFLYHSESPSYPIHPFYSQHVSDSIHKTDTAIHNNETLESWMPPCVLGRCKHVCHCSENW